MFFDIILEGNTIRISEAIIGKILTGMYDDIPESISGGMPEEISGAIREEIPEEISQTNSHRESV